jgi:hypothetical protein
MNPGLTSACGTSHERGAAATLRAGKIWREVDYFAPQFDPPAWRAPYVEDDNRQPPVRGDA